MRRLQVLNIASRETNRLPANVIRKTMNNASLDLPLNLENFAASGTRYIVYHLSPMEWTDEITHALYILVEITGSNERILAKGWATGLSTHNVAVPYVSFHGKVNDMNFAFYCKE